IYLMYNLPGNDSCAYMSAATQELYGRKTNNSPTVPTP
ncbi:chitinase, partial [Enterococcus faecalis]